MFNIDLSKALNPKSFRVVAPLVPGLFFELSMLLSGRYSFRGLSDRAQLGYVTSLAIALVVAYVIGDAVLLWVRLLQYAMVKTYGFVLSKKAAVQPTPNTESFQKEVDKVWCQATVQLLKQGYGIDPKDEEAPSYLQAWYYALGKLDDETMRGRLSVMASQATGWIGLVAAIIAPSLRNRFYLGLSLFLLLYGLFFANWDLMLMWNDPTRLKALRTIAILSELKDVRTRTLSKKEASED